MKVKNEFISVFNSYAKSIGSIREISEKNEILVMKAKLGDSEAKKKIVEKNIKLVVKIASSFNVNKETFTDIIQEGILGLMRAIAKYNPKKGVKFSTYASFWIKSYMISFLSRSNTMGVLSTRECYILAKIRDKLGTQKFSDTEKLNKLLKKYNVSLESFKNILAFSGKIYFSDLIREEDNCIEQSIPSDFSVEEYVEEKRLVEMLNQKINLLHPKERFVIEKRYGLNGSKKMSLNEIASYFKVSPESVRYTEKRAIDKLRDILLHSCEFSELKNI